MSRTAFPFEVADLSAFARNLRRELTGSVPDDRLGHVETLNLVCRAAGWRNFQHFRAAESARARLAEAPPPPPAPVDWTRVERTARHFDRDGRLIRWPTRANQVELALWVLWSRLPAGRVFDERSISVFLLDHHGFGDPALLRRSLAEYRLVTRTRDGRIYQRVEQPPPPELKALTERLRRFAAP